MKEFVAARGRQRDELIEKARAHVNALEERVGIVAAAVVGSVARGDFNLWSDIDVVVVATALPPRLPERLELLGDGAAPGVQVIGFTLDEFRAARRKKNKLVMDALETEVVLKGDLRSLT